MMTDYANDLEHAVTRQERLINGFRCMIGRDARVDKQVIDLFMVRLNEETNRIKSISTIITDEAVVDEDE